MSTLPNVAIAVIEQGKICDYLLSDPHPVGGPKAAFFKSFGFNINNPDELAEALLAHAKAHPAVALPPTVHGQKYEISGPLACPDGRLPHVKAVWIVDAGQTIPRLVTAVPD